MFYLRFFGKDFQLNRFQNQICNFITRYFHDFFFQIQCGLFQKSLHCTRHQKDLNLNAGYSESDMLIDKTPFQIFLWFRF